MTRKRVRTFDDLTFATPLTIDGRRAVFVSGADSLGYVLLEGETQPVEVWLTDLTDVREV